MSRLRTAFERYIGMRQGLGHKYDGPAKRLSAFVAFMEARGVVFHVCMSRLLPSGHHVLAQNTRTNCQIGAHENRSKSDATFVRDLVKSLSRTY
jgi:hypothetical protein